MATREEIRARSIAALNTVPTYGEQLAKVKTAISEILETGQSVSYGGRSLTSADLKALRETERDYEIKAQAEIAETCGRSRVSYITPIT